jgi:hypothetical protein
MAIPFFDRNGREKLPNYTFRTRTEQTSKLKKFLKDVKNFAYIYETENENAGGKFLWEHKDQVDLDFVRENATLKAETLVDIAEEELTPEEVLNLLFESSDPQPGPGVSENSLIIVPVTTIETDLHQFKGRINTTNFADVYKKMTSGLTNEQIEEAHDASGGEIINDVMYQEPQYDFWQGVIDEDVLKENLALKLQTNEKALEEINPAVAHVLVKVLGKFVVVPGKKGRK